MSNTDICSYDQNYRRFGAAMANLLHRWDRAAPARAVAADSAAPARAVAALAAVCTPGTKKSPPITVAKRTYLTKRPYIKWQKGSPMPVPFCRLQCPLQRLPLFLSLPSARPPHAHLWRRSPPPVLPAMPAPTFAVATVPSPLDKLIHPSGILVEIVETKMSSQGCLFEEHKICGTVLKEDVVVCLRKMQLMVEGNEETEITAI